jgi:hypothetical protein
MDASCADIARPARDAPPMELVGREPETVELEALLDCIDHHGAALLVHGERGAGKSALLEVATQQAVIRGMRVLKASGVQSEAQLAYAGLQQLLRPIIRGTDALAPAQRNLLRAALGWVQGPDPEPLHLAVAVGELLAATAARAPIVLIVDDLHCSTARRPRSWPSWPAASGRSRWS